MATTGYSGTPLAKKLGIKPGFKMALISPPVYYFDLFTDMPTGIAMVNDESVLKDLIHFFTKDKAEFMALLPQLKSQIVQNGMIWISWPKKASKVSTDITEDVIRDFALQIGLVMLRFVRLTRYGRA